MKLTAGSGRRLERRLAASPVSWSSGYMDADREADRLVELWRQRHWTPGAAPLHVHPLDLDKLRLMIADLLRTHSGSANASHRAAL